MTMPQKPECPRPCTDGRRAGGLTAAAWDRRRPTVTPLAPPPERHAGSTRARRSASAAWRPSARRRSVRRETCRLNACARGGVRHLEVVRLLHRGRRSRPRHGLHCASRPRGFVAVVARLGAADYTPSPQPGSSAPLRPTSSSWSRADAHRRALASPERAAASQDHAPGPTAAERGCGVQLAWLWAYASRGRVCACIDNSF